MAHGRIFIALLPLERTDIREQLFDPLVLGGPHKFWYVDLILLSDHTDLFDPQHRPRLHG